MSIRRTLEKLMRWSPTSSPKRELKDLPSTPHVLLMVLRLIQMLRCGHIGIQIQILLPSLVSRSLASFTPESSLDNRLTRSCASSSPPDYVSLDDYVFNTEAHPLKLPTADSAPSFTPSWKPSKLDDELAERYKDPEHPSDFVGGGTSVQLELLSLEVSKLPASM